MIALFDEFPAGAHPTKDQYEHFSIGRADERTARRAQAARASTNDDGQTVADTADMDEEEYNDADVELPHQERIGHDVATVHISTVAFHQKYCKSLTAVRMSRGGGLRITNGSRFGWNLPIRWSSFPSPKPRGTCSLSASLIRPFTSAGLEWRALAPVPEEVGGTLDLCEYKTTASFEDRAF